MRRDDLMALFALLDEAPVYVTLVEGPDLRVTMANRRVCESLPPVLGKPVHEFYGTDNPIIATLQRVYATGVAETLDKHPLYFTDGATAGRFFTRNYTPLREEDGTVSGVLVLGYEVTEQVRADQEHQEAERRSQIELNQVFALLEEAPAMITVVEGPELRIAMMNRRSRATAVAGMVPGASLFRLVPPTNETLMAARRVYDSGATERFEVRSRDVEGFVGRSFHNTVAPVPDLDGQTKRVMIFSFETTEQNRAQEALETQALDLEEARRQAVEASRAKDDFLAMLGHELRNPLAPIVTTLELMRLRGADVPEVELLERQVHYLIRLVDDLLDVSRIARGMVELKRRDIELATIVHRALEMTSPLLEKRRQRILCDLSPAAVHGDPDRLAQVAANLITNAAKYSERGSQICIHTERVGELARLRVTDAGIGIAPDMLARVFEAFVQQPQTLERSHGGLGLGLAIVKGLVEAHGGQVSAHSEGPARGSTFIIDLPAIETATSTDVSHALDQLRPFAQPMRILVVDDNRDAAVALGRALDALGHDVVVVHDGPSALGEARLFQPDVGLLDIGLPGMDGYELAGALRAAHDLRLVAVTGYDQERDRERSRAAGFEAHLVKPVDIEQLSEVLHQLERGRVAEAP